MQERRQQSGLVVEHLLEVRDQPLDVGRVPGEPAVEVIVDAPGRHGPEGGRGHLPRRRVAAHGSVVEGEVAQSRLGKLGGAAEAAPPAVEPGGERTRRLVEQAIGGRMVAGDQAVRLRVVLPHG
ncbi:MAG: hypothetical protein ACYCX8_07075, partial [Acidimicrobiales bacterium]